jgi:hypothetical protein
VPLSICLSQFKWTCRQIEVAAATLGSALHSRFAASPARSLHIPAYRRLQGFYRPRQALNDRF